VPIGRRASARDGDPGRHARHEPRYRDDGGYRHKPRKSFLHELFD
jgi:Zn-finger nucleic acid-binding protein